MPKVATKLSAGRPSKAKAATLSMADDTAHVRLNFLVPEPTRKKLKAYCVANDVSMSELLRQYVDTLKL